MYLDLNLVVLWVMVVVIQIVVRQYKDVLTEALIPRLRRTKMMKRELVTLQSQAKSINPREDLVAYAKTTRRMRAVEKDLKTENESSSSIDWILPIIISQLVGLVGLYFTMGVPVIGTKL